MENLVLYPHMCNFAYGDRRMHMGIPVCKRAGIAENFAYGDPITHNEIVRIRGLTYTSRLATATTTTTAMMTTNVDDKASGASARNFHIALRSGNDDYNIYRQQRTTSVERQCLVREKTYSHCVVWWRRRQRSQAH